MRRTRTGQRGAVALEFAFVFPVLLTLLGMMSAIGLGLKARHQILSYAASAARYCAFQKPTANLENSLGGCAQSYVNYAASLEPPGSFPTCVTPVQTASTIKTDPANTDLKYLVVTTSCYASWIPIVGPVAGVAWPGSTYQVIASSSMPFLGVQTLAIGPPPQ